VTDETGVSRCPKCGGERVRTARQLFNLINADYEQAYRASHPFQNYDPTVAASQPPGSGGADDGDYDHYNVEGSDPQLRGRVPRGGGGHVEIEYDGDSVADDIGTAVVAGALGFAGRAFAKRMRRAYDAKLGPAMDAKAVRWQQQWEQAKAEHDQIVARYPDLRSCTKDRIVFLDGGSKTVPVRELRAPVTMARAEAVVARLR